MSPRSSTVLVADDDRDLSGLIQMTLSELGYEVRVAENGLQALEFTSARLPDLILLDMRMPVMDGWTFAREFRNRHGRSAPIVVITAAEDSQIRADEIGADDYLGKPLDLERMIEIVEDAVSANSAGAWGKERST